ncbi:hypothetical protein [Solitalea koreensis]|uniref:Uncharacterized protein n=1 Tax=Solitalea koreensis TaxID=543615 RepID=A0A521BJB6_9SPHI|nr:hypothetical protein [Solitalea koreensis]SMO47238.1 hypothetical protein SAMN06265350_102246 [Solitalea koreensis]
MEKALSAQKINRFINTNLELWKRSDKLLKAIRYFSKDNISYSAIDDVNGLGRLGSTLFESRKFFIDDAQEIYIPSNIGSQVSRLFEKDVFDNIIKNGVFVKKTRKSILENLELYLKNFKNNLPELIIMSNQFYFGIQGELVNNKDFIAFRNENFSPYPFHVVGTFKEIPIMIFANQIIDEKVIICNISSGLKVLLESADQNLEFALTISEIDAGKAEELYENKYKNSERFREKTKGDAIGSLLLSLTVDTYVKANIEVKCRECFLILDLS